jgi:hypothetical protein
MPYRLEALSPADDSTFRTARASGFRALTLGAVVALGAVVFAGCAAEAEPPIGAAPSAAVASAAQPGWGSPTTLGETQAYEFTLAASQAASFSLSGAPVAAGKLKVTSGTPAVEKQLPARSDTLIVWFTNDTQASKKFVVTLKGDAGAVLTARKVAIVGPTTAPSADGESACLDAAECTSKLWCVKDEGTNLLSLKGRCKAFDGQVFVEGKSPGTCEVSCPPGSRPQE